MIVLRPVRLTSSNRPTWRPPTGRKQPSAAPTLRPQAEDLRSWNLGPRGAKAKHVRRRTNLIQTLALKQAGRPETARSTSSSRRHSDERASAREREFSWDAARGQLWRPVGPIHHLGALVCRRPYTLRAPHWAAIGLNYVPSWPDRSNEQRRAAASLAHTALGAHYQAAQKRPAGRLQPRVELGVFVSGESLGTGDAPRAEGRRGRAWKETERGGLKVK